MYDTVIYALQSAFQNVQYRHPAVGMGVSTMIKLPDWSKVLLNAQLAFNDLPVEGSLTSQITSAWMKPPEPVVVPSLEYFCCPYLVFCEANTNGL